MIKINSEIVLDLALLDSKFLHKNLLRKAV